MPESSRSSRRASNSTPRRIRGFYSIRCRPADEATVTEALAPFGRITVLKHHQLLLLQIPAGRSEAPALRKLRELHREGLCEFFTPVLQDRETQLRRILTDEIVVRFKPETSVRQRTGLQKRLGLKPVRRNEFVPNQWVVKVPKPTGLQTLRVSRSLDDADEVEFASPNFLSQHRR